MTQTRTTRLIKGVFGMLLINSMLLIPRRYDAFLSNENNERKEENNCFAENAKKSSHAKFDALYLHEERSDLKKKLFIAVLECPQESIRVKKVGAG